MNRLKAWAVDAFSADVRVLAAFRVAAASLALLDLWIRLPGLVGLYSDEGALPVALLRHYYPHTGWIQLHAWSGSPTWEAFLFAVQAQLALLVLVGWGARWAAVACAVLMLSLQNRNPLTVYSGDNFLRLILLWGAFTPWTERWSVDAWLKPRPPDAPTRGFSAGTVALLLQTPLVYWSTAAIKARWAGWHDGRAIYDSLHAAFWSRPVAAFIVERPELHKALAISVLAWEVAGPFLLFVPWRRWLVRHGALLGFLVMQLSFGLCLYVGPFPAISVVAMLPFLRLGGDDAPPATSAPFALRPALAAAVVFMLYATATYDVQDATRHKVKLLPPPARRLAGALGLNVPWNMFVTGANYDAWVMWGGRLADGTDVDLIDARPLVWRKPDVPSAFFRDMRWQKYEFSIMAKRYRKLYQPLLQYQARAFEREHPELRLVEAHAILYWKPMEPAFNQKAWVPQELAALPPAGPQVAKD